MKAERVEKIKGELRDIDSVMLVMRMERDELRKGIAPLSGARARHEREPSLIDIGNRCSTPNANSVSSEWLVGSWKERPATTAQWRVSSGSGGGDATAARTQRLAEPG